MSVTDPIDKYATRQQVRQVQRVLMLCRKLLQQIADNTPHASFGEAGGHMDAAFEALNNSLGEYSRFKDGE